LKRYDGSPLETVGVVKLECSFKEKTKLLKFHVVPVDRHPLLSAEACEDFGLLNVDAVHSVVRNSGEGSWSQNDICKEYKDVFTGLGRLPGKFKLQIDPKATPVKHRPRRVAIALKEPLRQKIKELEERKVLKKVTKPTDWISSMVAVKTNKL